MKLATVEKNFLSWTAMHIDFVMCKKTSDCNSRALLLIKAPTKKNLTKFAIKFSTLAQNVNYKESFFNQNVFFPISYSDFRVILNLMVRKLLFHQQSFHGEPNN